MYCTVKLASPGDDGDAIATPTSRQVASKRRFWVWRNGSWNRDHACDVVPRAVAGSGRVRSVRQTILIRISRYLTVQIYTVCI